MRERLLPALLVLPALVFATPLSPIADDPYPHLAGTGWAALALVPLALSLLLMGTTRSVTGATLRSAWPFLATLLWALVSWRLAPVTDTLEARRALCVLALVPLVLAGGAALTPRGSELFQWACVLLSLGWTGFALASGFLAANFAGVLGDTGSLSQAALGGAAIGAVWLVRARGARRAAGALAFGSFLVHVAAAPVLAGSHTLLAGLLLAAWLGRGAGRGALAGLALCALLAPFVGLAARELASGAPPSVEGAPAEPSHSLGGLAVRGRVWSAALGLVGAHPLLGAGPGQFQAAFPPFRDPSEIELSRHGVCSELDTEVEHAHNDWLQEFCELGIPGGFLFALGLALCARAALRALKDDARLPIAVAALALLVNAFVHAPLFANPASSVLAFALLGSLSAGAEAPRSGRGAGALLAAPALGAALFAPALVSHGRALRDYVEASSVLAGLDLDRPVGLEARNVQPHVERLHAAILATLAAAPDSAPGRLLAAREAGGSPESCDRVLEVRPHSVEAWELSATECARHGRTAEAEERYRRALALSPTHPRILRNAARLELTQGDVELGLELVERLRQQGCLAPQWLEALGGELVLELGAPERGARVLFGTALDRLVPEELHALREADLPRAEAGECLAQLCWAREHAGHGDFELALRNYRQARDRSRGPRPASAPLYVLELAAAELRANRTDEARQHVDRLRFDTATWERLPDWARSGLAELGLGRESGSRSD